MVFERDEVPEKNAKVTIDISTSFKKKSSFTGVSEADS